MMNDKEKYKDPPDNVWVDYPLPWIEGRCIPESRLRLDGDKWVMEYMYPAPDEDEPTFDDWTKGERG